MTPPTIDALDDLLRLIDDKASDLMFLMGLNKVIDEHTNDRRIEGCGEGQEDCEVEKENNETGFEDREDEEEYDCPVHGKLGGIDECPRC